MVGDILPIFGNFSRANMSNQTVDTYKVLCQEIDKPFRAVERDPSTELREWEIRDDEVTVNVRISASYYLADTKLNFYRTYSCSSQTLFYFVRLVNELIQLRDTSMLAGESINQNIGKSSNVERKCRIGYRQLDISKAYR
jgi:hypothetical protein